MHDELDTRILEWLQVGPMVLPELIARAECPVADVLTCLRRLGAQQRVRASRVHRGQLGIGPVWWHLPEQQAPRPRPRIKLETATIGAVTLVVAEGHDRPSPRSPQEVVERLAGTTTYRTLCGSFGGVPDLTTDEIDFSLATAEHEGIRHDSLARALAYAVAMHSLRFWPEVQAHGVPHLLRVCSASRLTRPLVAAERRVRLRFVLWDAFHALVGEASLSPGERAKAARMRRGDYEALYGLVFDELHGLAGTVISDAVQLLRDDLLRAA